MKTSYKTFQVSIVNSKGLKFLEIVACDASSALADVREAYSADVEIVALSIIG